MNNICDDILNLCEKKKASTMKLSHDVKTKDGVIPKGTVVDIISKSKGKIEIESPDGLTATIKG